MSCPNNSNPKAQDYVAAGVDSYFDTVVKYAGLADGSNPKLAGYAKLGTANTVISMSASAFNGDSAGVAKAYSSGVAGYVVGEAAFVTLSALAVGAGGGVVLIGAAAVAAAAAGMAASWGINRTIDLINCELDDPDKDPTDPFTPDPDDSNNKDYRIEYYDPVILDLNGNGVKTVNKNGYFGALFDHDGDGIRTATGWVDKEDGLLVRDINGNGKIDNGTELFGNNTILENGKKATNEPQDNFKLAA